MKLKRAFKISLRKAVRKTLAILPNLISHEIIRRSVRVKISECTKFEVKIANTKEEFLQGFQLLYQCYREQGYQQRRDDFPFRITKYHILPTATMFVVKKGDLVVGTVSHIIDSKLGLPTETSIDLSSMRKRHSRIAEISALAIRKEYRREFSLMFLLTRIVYHFSREYAGCDAWVISVRSQIEIFYRAIFFFKRIHNSIYKNSFVNNVSSVSLYADLNELPHLFKYFYSEMPENINEKNLYHFYDEPLDQIFSGFPESIIRGVSTPTLNRELVQCFFGELTEIWSDLSSEEKQEVLNTYHDPDLFGSSQRELLDLGIMRRTSPRHLTNVNAEVVNLSGQFLNVKKSKILKVSRQGFLLSSTAWIDSHSPQKLILEISPHLKLPIEFDVLNQVSQDCFACVVSSSSMAIWQKYFIEVDRYCRSHLAEKS